MSEYHVVIPARFASQRLPGKPLLDMAGKPMIQHVYERALESAATDAIIATDDQRIYDAAVGFGARVCMTSSDHSSGTDRIAEVVAHMGWPNEDLVVNLQGDEPLMPPQLLDQVAHSLVDHLEAVMSTLAVRLENEAQVFDPNIVKLVTDHHGMALYFSRAPIPWKRDNFDCSATPEPSWIEGLYRHLGIYAYRVGFLRQYINWPQAPIEQMESLEQLRVLWHGARIAVSVADHMPPPGVDTQEDFDRVAAQLQTICS